MSSFDPNLRVRTVASRKRNARTREFRVNIIFWMVTIELKIMLIIRREILALV